MKAGEYVGVSGEIQRWESNSYGYFGHWTRAKLDRPVSSLINRADLRPAAAALLAKADELETEYVEFSTGSSDIRVTLVAGEPTEAHERDTCGNWQRLRFADRGILAAFGAGQERGQR